MARIVVSASADDDVGTILDYLAANAGHPIAERYAQAFEATYARLATFPRIGPTRSALGPHTRIWIVPPYVMIYDYVDDTVTMLRVLHGKQSITGALLARR
jgi:plasmid stabilization system protein ParE